MQIVPPQLVEMLNSDGKTPRQLFTEQHKMLREEGENWMRGIASACTVVAALIVTIMFAAVFTVPGGYKQDIGSPIYLHKKYFLAYIIADALSLFSSSTSVLMFLGILTSRYREEDFLKLLPTKLVVGLSSLFFSIAAMMATFVAALYMLLCKRWAWKSLPVFVAPALIPIMVFAWLQFPLLVEIYTSTYGRSIFGKSKDGKASSNCGFRILSLVLHPEILSRCRALRRTGETRLNSLTRLLKCSREDNQPGPDKV